MTDKTNNDMIHMKDMNYLPHMTGLTNISDPALHVKKILQS